MVLIAPFDDRSDEPPFVAVFQQDDQQPAFMLSVDLDSRRLNVRPVTAKPLPDRSYQLWIKAESLGPEPRSVGVLNDDLSLPADALSDYDPELLKQAKPDAELAMIAGMNHVMRITPAAWQEQLTSYDDPQLPLARALGERIVAFIRSSAEKNGR